MPVGVVPTVGVPKVVPAAPVPVPVGLDMVEKEKKKSEDNK